MVTVGDLFLGVCMLGMAFLCPMVYLGGLPSSLLEELNGKVCW